VDVNTIINLVC